MSDELSELQQLAQLLKVEKQKDFEQFRAFVQSLPLAQRVTEGYAWYPVEVIKSGFTYGERAYVTVTRTKESDAQHQFRAGQPVRFFSNSDDVRNPEKSGIIHFLDKKRMKIILSSKDLPDWVGHGSLGVDLEFDERTYLEMEKALKKVQEAKGNRLAELRRIILGQQPADIIPLPTIQLPLLNDSQNNAVNQILAARDVAIVHGPPGTGKTTTLVEAI
ncbi:MAG: AAA domain-containing protein, partial [Saprospiraceae bacterium]